MTIRLIMSASFAVIRGPIAWRWPATGSPCVDSTMRHDRRLDAGAESFSGFASQTRVGDPEDVAVLDSDMCVQHGGNFLRGAGPSGLAPLFYFGLHLSATAAPRTSRRL